MPAPLLPEEHVTVEMDMRKTKRPDVHVGDMVKVHLPGESPWACCVMLHQDGTWEGRIDNRLVTDWTEEENRAFVAAHFPNDRSTPLEKLHTYHQNDVVQFAWILAFDNTWLWMPERRLVQRRVIERRAEAR